MRASGGGSQPRDAPFSPCGRAHPTRSSKAAAPWRARRRAPSGVTSRVRKRRWPTAARRALFPGERLTRPSTRGPPRTMRPALSSIRSDVALRKRRRDSGSRSPRRRDGTRPSRLRIRTWSAASRLRGSVKRSAGGVCTSSSSPTRTCDWRRTMRLPVSSGELLQCALRVGLTPLASSACDRASQPRCHGRCPSGSDGRHGRRFAA